MSWVGSVEIKYLLCFKEKKKIVYFEPNINNHVPGTQIQVTVDDMFHCGRGYTNFL
jgi:hypothetical protein